MTTKLVTITNYRRDFFAPGSAPDRRTVIARIRRGDLVGEQQGRTWYVAPDLKPSKAGAVERLIAKFQNTGR